MENGTLFIGPNDTLYEYTEDKVFFMYYVLRKYNIYFLQNAAGDYSNDSDEICCKFARKSCVTRNKKTSCKTLK